MKELVSATLTATTFTAFATAATFTAAFTAATALPATTGAAFTTAASGTALTTASASGTTSTGCTTTTATGFTRPSHRRHDFTQPFRELFGTQEAIPIGIHLLELGNAGFQFFDRQLSVFVVIEQVDKHSAHATTTASTATAAWPPCPRPVPRPSAPSC
jgi:hypothetical protein